MKQSKLNDAATGPTNEHVHTQKNIKRCHHEFQCTKTNRNIFSKQQPRRVHQVAQLRRFPDKNCTNKQNQESAANLRLEICIAESRV